METALLVEERTIRASEREDGKSEGGEYTTEGQRRHTAARKEREMESEEVMDGRKGQAKRNEEEELCGIPVCDVEIGGVNATAVWDMCATKSFMSAHFARAHGASQVTGAR